MPALLLGSHPAVDFLNTARTPDGVAVETIGSGREYLAWLVESGLLDEALATRLQRRAGADALDAAAAEARELREWARTWLERWREAPGGNYAKEVERLNRLLDRMAVRRRVVASGRTLRLEEGAALEGAEDLLGLIAAQIAALVTTEDPSLLRSCAGSACSLWFLDRTKAHRRTYCSATACGNRAKAAAFRERQRSQG
jgi:predicted RNA-binding Zn ribbon-like protein